MQISTEFISSLAKLSRDEFPWKINMFSGGKIGKLVFLMLATLFLVMPVFASTTDGTISSGDAWSANIGWINFASTNGNVHVTDSALTGHVWSSLYGWIKLDTTTSGVTNNAEGALSGSAWGENIGWINFSGVVINSNGVFTGSASGDNTGAINFGCTNCLVQTDWRPASTRTTPAPPSTPTPSGGTALPVTISPPAPVIIPTTTTSTPELPSPVIVTPTIPVSTATQTPIGQIITKVKGAIGIALGKIFPVKVITAPLAKLYYEAKLWIPGWFKAPPVEKIPIERFVAKKTPLALSGVWEYLDPAPTKRFVFAPLPKEFLALTNKFPQVDNVLQKVGIKRFSDLEKLKSVQMSLPSLTQAVAFGEPKLPMGKFDEEKAVPVGELSSNLKEKIPSDVIFARTAGQLVDFKIALSLTAKGRPEQKISTVSGKPLQLTVRPEFPAKRVRGFLVFRSKQPQARVEMPLTSVINSLIFAEPAFAYTQEQPVQVEERLVLLEFDYIDPDGDGIYTADIQSPVPAGEYEIITVIDYVDPDIGSKQIRLITVIDPEGYVFEKVGGKELRIPGAIATLYHFNPEKKAYEEWPAKDFQQENPQVTGLSGSYSFLVPGGTYSLKVQAPGYLDYEGKPFIVEEGSGVHMNIELKAAYWWLKVLDWKTALLVLVAMLLLFNFYKDKMRERREAKLHPVNK